MTQTRVPTGETVSIPVMDSVIHSKADTMGGMLLSSRGLACW